MKHLGRRIAATLAAVLLLLSGCEADLILVHDQTTRNGNTWCSAYKRYSGIRQIEVTLEAGAHSFTVDIVTAEGALDLEINKENGETVYTGKALPAASFDAASEGGGTYTIRFTAKDRRGSFAVNWE